MSKRINRQEIAEEGVLDNLLKPLKDLKEVLDSTDKSLKDFASTVEKDLNFGDKAKELRSFTESEQKLNKVYEQKKKVQRQSIDADQEILKLKAKLEKLNNDEAKDVAKLKVAISEKNRELRAEAKAIKNNTTAYSKLSKESRDLKNRSKELGAQLLKLESEGKKNTKEFKELSTSYRTTTKEAQRTDAQLKKLDATVGDNFRNVGNYKSALNGASRALGQLGIAMGVGTVIRGVTSVIGDYNQATTDLGAISGKSAEELKPLNDQARELGATTQFSATEVTQLQIELAKLGFTTQEITDSTGGIANFAAATGVEIPRAASLAGSALRAFGLDASEMDRVVSTLGVATTKTALDVSQLETGLSSVAPVAAAFGFSIEDTTALLGQLSNAGFDASSAATSTRNILLNLADANGSLAQELGRPVKSADDLSGALKELDNRGVDLAAALELTDKRSVAAFQTFLGGADSLVPLRDSITDVNDELTDMAEKRIDSVSGALKLLSSAFQEQVLGFNEATGASDKFQATIKFLAENLGAIVSIIGRLVVGFLSYKAILIAINVQQKIASTGVRGLAKQFFTLKKGATEAGTASKGMGSALKGIGWSALIGVAIELAVAFYDMASGADEARRKAEELDAYRAKASKDANNRVSQRNKELNDEIANLERKRDIEISASKTEKERQSIQEQFLKDRKTLVEENNNIVKQDLINEKTKLRNTKALQKALEKEIQLQKELTKEGRREDAAIQMNKVNKIATQLGKQLGLTSEAWFGLIEQNATFIEVQSNLNAEIEASNTRIKIYNEELDGSNSQLKDVNASIKINTNERENNRNKINAQVKSLGDQNKELEKQKEDIDLISDSLNNEETLDIDASISKQNEAIKKAMTERLTMINDLERNQTLTEKEAQDQRLIAEIEALNERKKILELYGRDVTDINNEISQAQLQLSKGVNSDIEELLKGTNKNLVDSTQETIKQVVDSIDKFFNDFIDRQMSELQNQEESAKQMYGTLEKLAVEGNIQAQQSLTEMLEAQQKAQREQIRLQQRQQRIEQAKQVYSIIQSQLDAGKSPSEAIASTGGYMTAIQGLIQSLPSFYEGTEDTGKAGKPLDNKGGRLAVLHNNERVLTAEQNKALAGIPNPMIPTLVQKGLDSAGTSYDLLMINELQRTRKAIENIPQTSYEVQKVMGEFAGLLARSKKGNSITKTKYN